MSSNLELNKSKINNISNFEIGVFISPNTKNKCSKTEQITTCLTDSSIKSNSDSSTEAVQELKDSLVRCKLEHDSADDHECGTNSKSALNNPVFQQLSRINGEINRMDHGEIRAKLRELNLDSRGKKNVIKKRLKTYYKKNKLGTHNIRDPNNIVYHYENFIVVDFEATCEKNQAKDFKQEIIEFPAILINSRTKCPVSEFHTYVRPIINPVLSEFCTLLTGIEQKDVDEAPSFSEVLDKFEVWLHQNGLSPDEKNYAFITDGPWDMGRFMFQQCSISNIKYPLWAKRWINIRKSYSNFYSTKRVCLQDMLSRLGLKFEGRPHCGIDDARNIARIAQMLLKDGANLRLNERIHLAKNGIINPRERMVQNVTRKEFEAMNKDGKPNCVQRCNGFLPDEDEVVAVTEEYLNSLDEEMPSKQSIGLNLSSCVEFPNLRNIKSS